jgi:hypothetical protein
MTERTLNIRGVEREVVMLCAEQANRENMPLSKWVSQRLRAAAAKASDEGSE